MIISAQNLTKTFKGVVALDKLNFETKAGKSTLIRLIAGLLTSTAGELKVLGLEVRGNEQLIQEKISYMPQSFGLYQDLTILENMTLYADLHGVKKSARRELWQIIKKLVAEENLSVLVSTAYMDEAELCENVFVINRGKILMSGSPEEIKSVASGRCFKVRTPQNFPTRILQSILLDDKTSVVDSVPERNFVRFISRAGLDSQNFSERLRLPVEKIPARLEDSFMILLHKAEQNNLERVAGMKKLSLDEKYSLSNDIDIVVKNLVRKFGDFTAVDKTSFDVRCG